MKTVKTLNVRALREAMPRLKETLAVERELLLVSGGEPVGRILPVEPPPRRRIRSLAPHRAKMTMLPAGTIEQLIRDERDKR